MGGQDLDAHKDPSFGMTSDRSWRAPRLAVDSQAERPIVLSGLFLGAKLGLADRRFSQ